MTNFDQILSRGDKTSIFIDGANLYNSLKGLRVEFDYQKLRQFFQDRTNLVRAYYYSASLDTDDYVPNKPLFDWLSYNGYILQTKLAKEYTDANGRRRIKGNMDIEISVDMMEQAGNLDHAILFSGDSDFRMLVEAVQRRGAKVTVISTSNTSPPMIGDMLRKQADFYMDLVDLIGICGKTKIQQFA